MRRWLLAIALLTAWLASSAHAFSQEVVSASGKLIVSFDSALEPLAINRMHSWIVTLRTASGEPVDDADIEIRGGMPAHNHGLPTAPRVTARLGDGRYRIEGMKFHMHGSWVLELDVTSAGQQDTVVLKFEL